MAPDHVGIDFAAFRRTIEGSVVRNILKSTGAVEDAQTRKIIFNTRSVFERHGIGAVEAVQIMTELGEALK